MEPADMEEILLLLGDTINKCQAGHLLKSAGNSAFL